MFVVFVLAVPRCPGDFGYKLKHKIACDQGAVRAVRLNVDGDYCLTSGSNKTFKLWNPVTKKLLQTYAGHGNEVLDANSSCDNNQLVSGGLDRAVLVWEVGSGKILRNFRGCHAGAVNCVKFNEDSTVVISGSTDATAKCWDVRSRRMEPVQTLDETTDTVTSIDVSDHEILVGCADCKLRRYDLRNGHLITDLVGSHPITCVKFSEDGQCVLVNLSQNEPVRLFDKSTGGLLQEFQGHRHNGNYRLDAAFDDTNKYVLCGSEDGCVYGWDILSAKIAFKLEHDQIPLTVHSLSHHHEKPLLVTAARGDIYLWERN